MDFSRTTNNVILNTEAELIIQQIDILLDTDKGEVLGEPSYGSDYDKFLHELNVGNEYIQDYIYNHITENVDLFGWELTIEVQFMMGTTNDIILVGIEISNEQESYTKVYKIDTTVHDPDKTII